MNHRTARIVSAIQKYPVSLALASSIALASVNAAAATAPALPDSPSGQLGAQIVAHINKDSPDQIEQWARGVLSAAMAEDDKAGFIGDLLAATRNSGGVDIFDVQTDPHQPGTLGLVVKARHGGELGMFMLAIDPLRPGKLAQANLGPMDDPALYAAWPKGTLPHEQMARLIHATLDKLASTTDFSGCVTVADGDHTLFDECRGLAERSFGVAIDDQTTFHIGSIGKVFTAVAIAQLVEEGKLSWTATLADLVPDYPDREAARKINVWQLLHHTAGLGDFFVPEYFQHREKFVDPGDYLDLIARQPKVGDPGKDWSYSNSGYILLGRIIENVSHEGYFDYVQRHVFAPAGMLASGFDSLDEVTPKLAVGYFHDGMFSDTWKADWMKLGIKGSPAGGGYSNNADLLRFAAALRGGKLVQPATLAKMFDDEVPAGPGSYAAGFGDRVSHGQHIRGHAGGIEGTDANLQMVWGTNAAVALTSNEGPAETWMLAEHIADLLAAEAQGGRSHE